MDRPVITLQRLAIALPITFLLHVAEEAADVLDWVNARVDPDVSMHVYAASATAVFVITVAVAHLIWIARDRLAASIALAWIGFAIFGNAVYHIAASIGYASFMPGTVTAVMLYLPVTVLLVRATIIECRMPAFAAILIALAGGAPIYIHVGRVVTEGRRLF